MLLLPCLTLMVRAGWRFAYRLGECADTIKLLDLWHSAKDVTDSDCDSGFEEFLLLLSRQHDTFIIS